jgi:hypothetical protein
MWGYITVWIWNGVQSLFCLLQGMGSPSSAVEAARRRLRDVVRRGEKLGLTRSDLVSLPAARRLTSSGSRWCWRSTSLAITVITVIMAVTAILTKCYVYHQATTAAYPSGVSAASLDPWWQPQQLQRLVSAAGLFVCLWFVFISPLYAKVLVWLCYVTLYVGRVL